MADVQRPNETSTPATMAAALEPPLTPRRTPTPLGVVSEKESRYETDTLRFYTYRVYR